MTDSERTRVAAYALSVDPAGRILLCRISPSVAPGEIWTLPGGGLEFGESPRAAVLRELDEESGYHGEVVALADVFDRVVADASSGGRLHAIRIVYHVRVTGGDPRDEIDGSTDTCGWFSPQEARQLNLGELAGRALGLVAGETRAGTAAAVDTTPGAPTTQATA
jgi:8-oxo-dGTP diphosphatase